MLTRRLAGAELHPTDLAAGDPPSGWPGGFAAPDLPEPMRSQRADWIMWHQAGTPR